jgi:protein-arginine kinase activator protein McsA
MFSLLSLFFENREINPEQESGCRVCGSKFITKTNSTICQECWRAELRKDSDYIRPDQDAVREDDQGEVTSEAEREYLYRRRLEEMSDPSNQLHPDSDFCD